MDQVRMDHFAQPLPVDMRPPVNKGASDIIASAMLRTIAALTWTATAVIGLTADVCGQADDECTGATPIQLGSVTYSNAGYTTSAEPWVCGSAPADRWFLFVPPTTSPYTIRACNIGQSVDTFLEVYEGGCGTLQDVACGQDRCGHFGLGDEVQVVLSAGNPYLVRVGVLPTATPSYTLSLTTGPGSLTTSTPSGCGSATLSFSGLPTPGGQPFRATLENFAGAPFVGAGLNPSNLLFCSCTIGHDWTAWVFGPSLLAAVPPNPSLINQSFYLQGADLGTGSGCQALTPGLTNTWRVTIGV